MLHEDIIKSIEPELEKAVDFVQKKLSSIRTGRASPALVEDIKVDNLDLFCDFPAVLYAG